MEFEDDLFKEFLIWFQFLEMRDDDDFYFLKLDLFFSFICNVVNFLVIVVCRIQKLMGILFFSGNGLYYGFGDWVNL